MTPANRIKLEKAGRELLQLSQSKADAQDVLLLLLRTLEMLHLVQTDLVMRPEMNAEVNS